MKPHYNFSDYQFLKAHGKAPRGQGFWAFTVKGVSDPSLPDAFIEKVSESRTDTVFFVPGAWPLAEAKKRAAIILEAHAIPSGTTVYVAP